MFMCNALKVSKIRNGLSEVFVCTKIRAKIFFGFCPECWYRLGVLAELIVLCVGHNLEINKSHVSKMNFRAEIQKYFRSVLVQMKTSLKPFWFLLTFNRDSSPQESNTMTVITYISHGLCVQKLAEHLLHILGRWCHHSKITLWTQEGLVSSYFCSVASPI